MGIRSELIASLWQGIEPFAAATPHEGAPDLQGWRTEHPFLRDAIATRPRVVAEVGVWKGGSVVFMAKCLRHLGVDGVIIAVDTWLGSWEHWFRPEWRTDLMLQDGYPSLYRTFQRNIVSCGVQDFVIPLPLDSLNAAALLRCYGISPDVVHLDAGHERRSVLTDLQTWWERLRPGGLFIADDYDPTGKSWPSARDAIDEFATNAGSTDFRVADLKVIMTKPSASGTCQK